MSRDDDLARWRALLGFAVLVAYVVIRELGNSAYDDSYFFKRFALHAVEHGTWAWNLDDGPVYGSTSQLFQLLTTLVAGVTKTHFIAAVRVLDGCLLVAAAGILLRGARAPLVIVAMGNALVLSTVRSNMETALALAVLAWALIRELGPPRSSALRRDLGSVIGTVLVYLARPDAALIVAVVAVARRWHTRSSLLAYVGAAGLSMAAVWATAWAYYGSALPLSFHMKTMAMHTYGPYIESTRWQDKLPNMVAFAIVAAPMVWLLARASVWRRRDAAAWLTLGAVAFVAYHVVATHEIMGYRARFYVPALVPLVLAASKVWPADGLRVRAWLPFVLAWAAAATLAVSMGWAPDGEGFFLTRLPWPTYAALIGASVCGLGMPMRPLVPAGVLLAGTVAWLPLERPTLRSDAEIMVRHNREVTTTRGVYDVARCLPPGSTVYHSEMGVPGLVLYRMRLVDMAGLLSQDVARRGLDFEARCAAERPEAIFLPHRNYRALNAEIAASSCFADYVRVVDRSSSALHVREDLAPAFLACGTEYREWIQAPSKR